AVGTPLSCCFSTAMICSSLNLDLFIIRLPRWDGFYLNLEEETGLRTNSPTRTGRIVSAVKRVSSDLAGVLESTKVKAMSVNDINGRIGRISFRKIIF
ncbi:MAG: hypothetical protein AAF557_22610, partial [Pseudomonadota bacterium]